MMVVLVVMMVLMIFASEKVLSMRWGGTYLCLSRLAHDGAGDGGDDDVDDGIDGFCI